MMMQSSGDQKKYVRIKDINDLEPVDVFLPSELRVCASVRGGRADI